ncbi:hypothetical protein [Haliangium sp.]|uniref:hypothetical protein n=1 Tax=Haliangium sp. TaxID=2663208 RepID=UPI003D104D45
MSALHPRRSRRRAPVCRPGPGAARVALAAITLTWMGAGCGSPPPAPEDQAPAGEAITRTSESGPVTAVLRLRPEAPRLGDPLTLELEVSAKPGVSVEMPAFGEALGRFHIVQFVPRQRIEADGTTVASQTYTLQAPMSGRQRIPPLRLEFVDERPGRPAQDQDEGPKELLTEEIPIEIASVLPEGAVVDELRAERDTLPLVAGTLYLLLALAGVGLLAGVAVALSLRARRRARRMRARVSAYDRAMARLRALEKGGLPGPGEVDEWYVRLSGIVRHYLEDRFGLRAPELTTEEFLYVAQRAGELSPQHRERLSTFLVQCDRVKFARYQPGDAESLEALENAMAFLEETRETREAAEIPPTRDGSRTPKSGAKRPSEPAGAASTAPEPGEQSSEPSAGASVGPDTDLDQSSETSDGDRQEAS